MKFYSGIYLVCITLLMGANPRQTTGPVPRNAAVEHVIWDGNRISTVHGNHGDVVSYHVTSESGLEWPQGSGKMASFQSGHWLASGKVRAQGGDWVAEIRTAAAEYLTEYIPGRIGGEDQSGHIYQIHRAEIDSFLNNDWDTFSSLTLTLPVTIISGFSIYTEWIPTSLPTPDFMNWPVQDGAPWVDANGDGIYRPQDGDHPDILGDMFHWYVMNDSDPDAHNIFGTNPMNVEVQLSLFGFDREGPLGDALFIRQVLTNRGSDDLDSVYIGFWQDNDLGDASDDLVGCDIDLDLGYTYNDPNGDYIYGTAVPAIGSSFLQGPVAANPGGSARILTWDPVQGYHFNTIPDHRRLPMTAFPRFLKSIADPDPNSALHAYRALNGLSQWTGNPLLDPVTGQTTPYSVSGNPVSHTGWIDAIPGDRRQMICSGPFRLLSGETQEIITSIVIAGGADWARSVARLKANTLRIREDFSRLFEECVLAEPQGTAAMLDGRVVLTWETGSDLVEAYSCGGFRFQGYNVYQGSGPEGPWTRIATYDVKDGYRILYSGVEQEMTGDIIRLPVQEGSDSGLQHFLELERDLLRDTLLVNNRTYYYAVTAYVFDPDPEVVFAYLESPKRAIQVIPSTPALGTTLENDYLDTLEVIHAAGRATGARFLPVVVDPYQLTGDDYAISFAALNDSINQMVLVNTTRNDTLIQTPRFPVSKEYYHHATWGGAVIPTGIFPTIQITDGFILTTENASYKPTNTYDYAHTVTDADTSTRIVFKGIYPPALGSPPEGDGTWYEYLLLIPVSRPSGSPPPDEREKDLQFRFTDEGTIGTYLNNYNLGGAPSDTLRLPFELWTVEPGDTVQIHTAVYQVSQRKPVFGPDSASLQGVRIIKNVCIMPVYVPYNRGSVLAHPFQAVEDGHLFGWMLQFDKAATVFESGNVFQVNFKNRIKPGEDVYTFSAPGVIRETRSDVLRDQIRRIQVFPNPYYGGLDNEPDPFDRYVYFTNLGPGKTTIRVFTLAGDLVARIVQVVDSPSSTGRQARWDLRNAFGKPAANGMYIVHISVEDPTGKKLGERVLKLAVLKTGSIY